MSKKKTYLKKSSEILENAKVAKWIRVNIDNEFEFMSNKYVIDEKIEEYKVYNKAGTVENYTNESYMEEIFVVLDNNDNMSFYNQKYDLIENKYIHSI